MVLNMGPLDWESSALTTMPLPHLSLSPRWGLTNALYLIGNAVNDDLGERSFDLRRNPTFFLMLHWKLHK